MRLEVCGHGAAVEHADSSKAARCYSAHSLRTVSGSTSYAYPRHRQCGRGSQDRSSVAIVCSGSSRDVETGRTPGRTAAPPALRQRPLSVDTRVSCKDEPRCIAERVGHGQETTPLAHDRLNNSARAARMTLLVRTALRFWRAAWARWKQASWGSGQLRTRRRTTVSTGPVPWPGACPCMSTAIFPPQFLWLNRARFETLHGGRRVGQQPGLREVHAESRIERTSNPGALRNGHVRAALDGGPRRAKAFPTSRRGGLHWPLCGRPIGLRVRQPMRSSDARKPRSLRA